MKETKVYVDEMPNSCSKCEWCTLNHKDNYGRSFCLISRMPLYNGDKIKEERGQHKGSLSDFDCPLKSLHEYKKELVAKVLGMVRENLKEELLLTKNENQEEAKLKLVKTYSIDLDVLNKIEKEILNGYTKI